MVLQTFCTKKIHILYTSRRSHLYECHQSNIFYYIERDQLKYESCIFGGICLGSTCFFVLMKIQQQNQAIIISCVLCSLSSSLSSLSNEKTQKEEKDILHPCKTPSTPMHNIEAYVTLSFDIYILCTYIRIPYIHMHIYIYICTHAYLYTLQTHKCPNVSRSIVLPQELVRFFVCMRVII